MIQNELQAIIKRFKENDYYQYQSNKENDNRRQSSKFDQTSTKQEVHKLNKKVKQLENTIQKMMIDGNKMHRFYEQVICDSALQFEAIKEQCNDYRRLTSEEKKEGENLIEFLNSKIGTLSKQISNKEEMYRDLLERYELLEERSSQAHLEQSEHVKYIEKQLARESMHHQEERMLTNKQIQQIKIQLKDAMQANEQLLNQNNYLKNMNESLAHNIQYLKNRLYAENDIIHGDQQRQQDNRISMIQLERCDVESISRDEDRFTLEEIKMNESQQINFNGEKQVLNLSQHYSKFNHTHQFLSKQKSNYDFVLGGSHQRQSFAKRKDLISQNKNLLVKIDSIGSNREKPNIKSRHITEIKEFKMQQAHSAESTTVDPYKAFFILLTQCEKMNSPYFQKISHIDLGYLYPQFLKAYIPYNQWQGKIKKELMQKSHCRK